MFDSSDSVPAGSAGFPPLGSTILLCLTRGSYLPKRTREDHQGGDGLDEPLPKPLRNGEGPRRQQEAARGRRSALRGVVRARGSGPAGVRAGGPGAARRPERPAGGSCGRGGAQVGWQWAGVAPRPLPSHPGAPATLGAGGARVSQAGFSLRLWGRRASATERVPPSSIRLRRPPAFSRRLPPGRSGAARSLRRTGALEGGFKSARGKRGARGVRRGASMVSGAHRGPGLDSGGGAVRELSPFLATLAQPQPRRPRSPV